MKKIMKKATFWFCIVAILIILTNMLGNDDKNIILIGLNPILNSMPLEFMNSGPKFDVFDGGRDISVYWYIGSFITMMLYGIIIDMVICTIRKTKK